MKCNTLAGTLEREITRRNTFVYFAKASGQVGVDTAPPMLHPGRHNDGLPPGVGLSGVQHQFIHRAHIQACCQASLQTEGRGQSLVAGTASAPCPPTAHCIPVSRVAGSSVQSSCGTSCDPIDVARGLTQRPSSGVVQVRLPAPHSLSASHLQVPLAPAARFTLLHDA
jgi:hypothetical protein